MKCKKMNPGITPVCVYIYVYVFNGIVFKEYVIGEYFLQQY